MRPFPLLLISLLTAFACSTGGKKSDTTVPTAEPVKNVNDLDYQQVVALVLADTSNLGEWHNSPLPSEANGDLSLSMEAPCGENDCGKRIYLVNKGNRAITATISTVYPLEETPWSLAQEVIVEPGGKTDLGCSHLCYGETNVSFDRAIEGSSYLE